MAERKAAARYGGVIRIGKVIEQIIARDNLERPVSPHARMPASPTQQRRRNKARPRVNLFIDVEAGVDGDASNVEVSDDDNDDLDGFIVADDIEF